MRKTNKDFGEALDELRVDNDLSYEQFSIQINDTIKPKKSITTSNIYAIINRRNASAPDNKMIEDFAKFFEIKPEYFYEYRLRNMLEFLDSNREFLDHCEKEKNKWSKKEASGISTDKSA